MSEQLALTLARKHDVVTSHAAAEKALGFRAKHEGKIYGALLQAGDAGLTAKQIALFAFPLDDVQVNRRLSSMGERKLIERIKIGNTADGRVVYEQRGGCCVWRIRHG